MPGWSVLLCEERPPHGVRAWVGMVAACGPTTRALHCFVTSPACNGLPSFFPAPE